MHILALKWKCQYPVVPLIYVLFLLSQKKQMTAWFLLCLHLIMSLQLQLSSLSPSFWLSPWQQDTSQGMVSATSFSRRCLLVLMEFLCRIYIYRNLNATPSISVPSSNFSHFLFFFFFLQHPLSQNLSLAHNFATFCVQATLEFRFESEEVTGSFDSRSK